ncbi:hypothetical protein LUZ63_021579 [Rhynchospora breviuscula]|uniref:F-box domain-containing protein n=1 Tax=Rhynchospora breviuscula TaxID=2022672 RepID=A0A9P9Z6D0_9POAL|nr:hypothetical protein LUZ63_021579 [Rhynchospora breviuscula]
MAAWSDLTFDALEHITSLLSFSDRYRFGAVCKNWRSVSKGTQHPPAPQLPWLVLEEESETRKRKFYSLSEDKHYSIEIPELYGRYICGSSHGWLFAVDIKISGIIINPFTRKYYELPPLPAYHKNVDVTTLIENVPSDCMERPRGFTFKEMQTAIVFKAILSHDPDEMSDFTIMILFGQMHSPAFWRPGDSSWTVVDGPKCAMEDVLYFQENFYIISAMNVLYVVDFEPEPKLIEVGPQICPEICLEGCALQRYLIDFNENMILIERFSLSVGNELPITHGFNMIEPNLEEDCLYEWYDIDDYAIFLGRNSAIFVDSSDVPECKKNAIYFTHITESVSPVEFGFHDLGVYDITDKRINTFYSVGVFPPRVDSPVWFTPNSS